MFRDGFFHADMHPGNILVSVAPQSFGRYIAPGLRYRRRAFRVRQELPGAEFHRLLPARLTIAWPCCTWNRAGCRRTRGWRSWKAPCAPAASLISTSRSRRSRWAWC
ncbi:hypothetical protein ACU4GD_29030 [Cupriavidus basilensis]